MSCDVCARNARTEQRENPFSVARTTTGYVNLADVQYHEGYTIFCAKRCVNELHELPADERDLYLREMAEVAEAVFKAFAPRKLNYELLGNGVPHLHWHVIPRPVHDRLPSWPVWKDPGFLHALDEAAAPAPEQLARLRGCLLAALADTDLTIERRFS